MEHDLSLHRGWFLEHSLVGIRWWMVPLGVVALPLFKPALWPLWVFHLLVLGVGNGWLTRLLRRSPEIDHLRVARSVATGLEWFTAIGALLLTSPDAATAAPIAMVVLLPVVAFRYGMRALIIAGTVTGVAVALLVSAQLRLLHILQIMTAWQVIEKWEATTIAMALIMYALLEARDACSHWQELQWQGERRGFRRFESGLSRREWEVLLLLADESLTIERIAGRFHRSPSTIKTHIARIGDKLGANGRREIVAVGRERGILPRESTLATPLDDTDSSPRTE